MPPNNVAFASTAKTLSVPYVDWFNRFLDTGTPATYFIGDGLHFAQAGYVYGMQGIKETLRGEISRVISIDFDPIAGNTIADVPVTVLNAVAGMKVEIVPIDALPAGVVHLPGYVSANDTVVVRLWNTTGSSIDPSAIKFGISVFTQTT